MNGAAARAGRAVHTIAGASRLRLPSHIMAEPSHVPSRAWNRSIAGRLVRSTSCGLPRSIAVLAGVAKGVASQCYASSASTPTAHRAHFTALKPPRTSRPTWSVLPSVHLI